MRGSTRSGEGAPDGIYRKWVLLLEGSLCCLVFKGNQTTPRVGGGLVILRPTRIFKKVTATRGGSSSQLSKTLVKIA